MRQAIGNLKVKPDLLLNDAVTIPEVVIPQVPIIKGDAKSISIAAASIVAKVTRDRLMEEYDKVLPGIWIRVQQRLWISRTYQSASDAWTDTNPQKKFYRTLRIKIRQNR